MGKYHKDVYMTKEMISQCPQLYCGNLEETQHFLERCRGVTEKYIFDQDRFDDVIQEIKETKPEPFEVETNKSGKVVKCCIRVPFDDYRDVCVVFRKNKIVTCWFNSSSDNHFTLDANKYDRS
jgi:hypothetical protein